MAVEEDEALVAVEMADEAEPALPTTMGVEAEEPYRLDPSWVVSEGEVLE